MTDSVRQSDPEIAQVLGAELERQRLQLEMIASENFTSRAVLETMGSVLTNKYAEGYPKKRYYGGCEHVDTAETLAKRRACSLFGAERANVQPHSGSTANMSAYLAFMKPGEKLLGLSLSCGGHLTHGHPVNFSGLMFEALHYEVDRQTETIDYDRMRQQAKAERPRLLVGGASAYPRFWDYESMRSIADEVEAIFLFYMAHVAGLIAGGYLAFQLNLVIRCQRFSALPGSQIGEVGIGAGDPCIPASRHQVSADTGSQVAEVLERQCKGRRLSGIEITIAARPVFHTAAVGLQIRGQGRQCHVVAHCGPGQNRHGHLDSF